MHKAGQFALVIGVLLTLVGLVGGFGAMFSGHDGPAKALLALVPLGFVAGFTGIVLTQLSGPRDRD